MKPQFLKFNILGKSWTIRLMRRKRYMNKNGKDSVAVADLNKRRIDLSPFGRDLETIVHELVHAYVYELCLGSTNDITAEDLEEIFAELMAKRGRELLDLADVIHQEIQTK